MTGLQIRPTGPEDKDWVAQFMRDRWGAAQVVVHGAIYYPSELPGFAAMVDGQLAGLVTYHVEADRCEVVTLDSLRPGAGIGTALVEAVKEAAARSACRRLWLVTTNDNLNALRFYQKRGFRLVAVHRGAVDDARGIKPEIPLTGNDGIPLHDEIELEMSV